jgi:antirestriction protein ArdC
MAAARPVTSCRATTSICPALTCIRDAESCYATLAHETTHWTRHPSRLDRDFGRKRYGDEGYAMEELVAELGSAFLSADLELTSEVRDDHAAYIASWIMVLKNDKRAIFSAASHAQPAADFLHGLQSSASLQAEAAIANGSLFWKPERRNCLPVRLAPTQPIGSDAITLRG